MPSTDKNLAKVEHQGCTVLFIGVLLVGAAIRLVLLPADGLVADVELFRQWATASSTEGIAALGRTISCNYMPIYPLILRLIGSVHQTLEPWFAASDATLNVLIKLPANLADLVVALMLQSYFRRRAGTKTSIVAFACYWLNPAMLYNSAWWGQIDSIVGLATVAGMLALLKRRYAAAFFLLSLGIMTKLQAVIFVPVFVALALRFQHEAALKLDIRSRVRLYARLVLTTAAGTSLAVLVSYLPFILAGNTGYLYKVATTSVGYYEVVSGNAYNFWWAAMGADAMNLWDGFRALGPLSYRRTGFLAFGGVVAALSVVALRPRFRPGRDIEPFAIAFFIAFSFYMLPTQMHERYVLYSLPMLAFACRNDRYAWGAYIILSLVSFFSLTSTVHFAYPDSPGAISFLHPAGRQDVHAVSFVNVALWICLAVVLVRRCKRGWLLIIAAAAPLTIGFLGAWVSVNRGGVPLSEIRPEVARQQWGVLRHDQSVGGRVLTVGGRTFDKGLGTHAASLITFNLDGKYDRFATGMGLDDESERGNRVRFLVSGDNKILFDSGPVGAGPSPLKCSVSVVGVQKLHLMVHPTEDGIDSDHADWLDPRLFR